MTRRDFLRLGSLAVAGLWARRAMAFGQSSKITFGQLSLDGKPPPRPHALRKLGFEIVDRTSLEVAPLPRQVSLSSPDLFETPFLYLSGEGGFAQLSDRDSASLRRFLAYGGFLVADSVDGGDAFDHSIRREIERAVPESSLQRVPGDHVLYKTFYLIDHQGGRQLVAPYLEGVVLGGRLAAVYSRNDLGGAWSRDDRGDWEFEVVPGGDEQREVAFRIGINLAMYATCLDYKDDQVHLPFILEAPPVTVVGSSSYNAWRIVSLSALPHWALWLLAAALVGGLGWTSRSLWRERRWGRRGVLFGLRALSALALLILLLEPGLQQLQTARVKSRFLVLIDRSRSMAFPAAGPDGATTRAAAVAKWAAQHRAELSQLADRFQLEVMGFAGEVGALDLEGLAQAPAPIGSRTDVLGSLKAAAQTGTAVSRALAGVLMISDGADNVQLARGVGASEVAQLRTLEAPVNTLSVGQGGLKDLAIAGLQVDDFAFVRNPLSLEVTLRHQGIASQPVPVVLTRAGRVIASQTVSLDSSGTTKLHLTFTPDQTGEFVYTVSVPVLPDEAVVDNNQRAFVLKVIRDRVRVLLVCGHPSWDERFLRGLLRQDPNVDLVSFFILRDVNDRPGAPADELSLIPFPTEEIFRTQLHSFDLVILQDFAYRPFSSGGLSSLHIESYFPDIKRYVQEGGALLMIGGENSFGEGQYDQTELADVLPVAGAGSSGPDEPFKPQLTEEGRRHPVTQLAESGEQSARLWGSLPAIAGLNLVKAKPGARVLLSHPLLSVGGENAPLLAVAEEGQGRSMALMTDSSWRWSFVAAGAGQGNRVYERFYTNAVRWLVRDPDLTPVKLSAAQRTIEPGQPAVFDVRARQADYGPAGGAQVTLTVFNAETEKQVAQVRATAANDGTVRMEVPDLPGGAYRAVAEATAPSEGGKPAAELGRAEEALAVRESGPETEDPLPHPELLERIAEVTGGTHAALGDGFPKLQTVHDSEEVEIGRSKELPLWDNAVSLGVLAVLLLVEWFLRRRWGFA